MRTVSLLGFQFDPLSVGVGFIGGAIIAGVLLTFFAWEARGTAPLVIGCLAIVVAMATGEGVLPPAEAIIVLISGAVAIIAASKAVSLFSSGDSIEMQSHWGGLGNSVGGWRLSPTAGLVLLSLASLMIAFSALLIVQKGSSSARPTSVEAPAKNPP